MRAAHRLALVGGTPRTEVKPESLPDLLQTIHEQIIPRLVLAHCPEPMTPAVCSSSRLPPTPAEVEEFASLAASQELPAALDFIEAICRQGLSLEATLLDLIAPAARLLGEQWKDDVRSFTEVTAALGVLQQVVHVLGPTFAPTLPHRGFVVLVAAPSEQHTLGLYLLGEFLRREGWGVQVAPAMSEADLIDLVASERVAAVGFSVSSPTLLKPLARTMAAVKKATCNPEMGLLLGGPLDLAAFSRQHGGVVCSSDPHDAVRWLEHHARKTKAIS
jgi:methanogenic corrinoid protein MtbC1